MRPVARRRSGPPGAANRQADRQTKFGAVRFADDWIIRRRTASGAMKRARLIGVVHGPLEGGAVAAALAAEELALAGAHLLAGLARPCNRRTPAAGSLPWCRTGSDSCGPDQASCEPCNLTCAWTSLITESGKIAIRSRGVNEEPRLRLPLAHAAPRLLRQRELLLIVFLQLLGLRHVSLVHGTVVEAKRLAQREGAVPAKAAPTTEPT